jgi:hypothetical protein
MESHLEQRAFSSGGERFPDTEHSLVTISDITQIKDAGHDICGDLFCYVGELIFEPKMSQKVFWVYNVTVVFTQG